MPLARARSSSAYFRPSSRPFSLVYWSRGRSALSAGAATARLMTPAAVKRRGSATAAAPASSLLLKNLLRADGDGLSPPSRAPGRNGAGAAGRPRTARLGPPPRHAPRVQRLERRRRVGDDGGALPGRGVGGAEVRRDRPGGVLPLRAHAAARAVPGGLRERARDRVAGDRVLDRAVAGPSARRHHRRGAGAAPPVEDLLRNRPRARATLPRLARADARRAAGGGAAHATRPPGRRRLGPRVGDPARAAPHEVRGPHRHRRRPGRDLPGAGPADGEPLGERAALRRRYRESEGGPGPGGARARLRLRHGGPQ